MVTISCCCFCLLKTKVFQIGQLQEVCNGLCYYWFITTRWNVCLVIILYINGLSRLPLEAKSDDVSHSCALSDMMELVNSPVSEVEVKAKRRKELVLSAVLNFWIDGNEAIRHM